MVTHAVATPRTGRALALRLIFQRVFSFPVFLGVALVAATFVGARFNLLDPDTWWHMKVGEQILRTGSWPTADSYSFTASGTPWIAYEWLGEVVMALAARQGGLQAPTVLLVGLAAVLILLLYYYSTLRSGNSKAAFVACALILPPATAFFTLRPQLIGYVFLLTTLICLEHFRRGKRWVVWLFPPLFLLWVNIHGTFVFGLLVLGLHWISGQFGFRQGGLVAERWKPSQSGLLAVVMLLCVLVLPLTPYGTRLFAYPLEMSLWQPVNIANIQEWQPLGFGSALGKMFLGLVLVFFLVYVVQRPALRLEEMALLLFGTYAACVHLRFVVIFLLAFTPLLALLLARWIPAYKPTKDRFGLNAALMALIVAGLVFFFPSNQDLRKQASKKYPVEAVEYLRTYPVQGRVLNDYAWGGYLIWALSPGHKVFIDGRADVYEHAGVLPDYLSITRLEPNAIVLLAKYGIKACLIERKSALGTMLGALPDWERAYSDETAVLYVHKRRHPAVDSSSLTSN